MRDISVIICTHNPREDYLRRVLDALAAQTLPMHKWELLLIDNASREPLFNEWDLSWHSSSRHIREEKLGLTLARLRGIKESMGEVLIFVDDDNVLSVDYLSECLRISKEYAFIGAWGGQLIGDFEVPPPEWSHPYIYMLALREFKKVQWSNSISNFDTVPCGAGMSVRASIAWCYVEMVKSEKGRQGLDRRGAELNAAGDTDMALTACDMGLGTAIFPSLRLTHLIPKERLELTYFERLVEGMARSHVLLQSSRQQIINKGRVNLLRRLLKFFRRWRMTEAACRLEIASERGYQSGLRLLNAKKQ